MHKSAIALTPVSKARLVANRRNAAKSTGPRTDAGKAASSSNSRSHGLTGHIAFESPEEHAAYIRLGRQLTQELKPRTCIQQKLVDNSRDAQWRMNRCEALDELLRRDREAARNSPANLNPADLTIEKLTRYLGRHTRAFFFSLAELKQLQLSNGFVLQQADKFIQTPSYQRSSAFICGQYSSRSHPSRTN
jgi:hypothetical protein